MKIRQEDIIRAALQEGMDPAKITPAVYRRLSIEIRSKKELLVDAAHAGVSVVATTLGLRNVSLEQAESNKKVCMECPSEMIRKFANGRFACDACNCSQKLLESKWEDAAWNCPLDHWRNTT